MTPEQIIKLLDAGYTKAEINSMINTEPKSPDINSFTSTPEPAATPDPEPQPAAEASEVKPEPDPLDEIKAQIAELNKGLATISKSIISPTLDGVKPVGADDVIVKFFKEI